MKKKILTLMILLMSTTLLIGYAYSDWHDKIDISGSVKTTNWRACVQIRKILYGAYYNYDPATGTYDGPTDQIAIAAEYPTYFKMIIEVENCGKIDLHDVVVTDTINNNVAPVTWQADKGTVEWDPFPIDYTGFHFDHLTWSIGNLGDGKKVKLTIWIQTLPNSAKNLKYAPTSGDEGDEQYIEINGGEEGADGATVTAFADSKLLTATTDGIMIHIIDDGEPGNGYGVLDTELPYYTDWAKDSRDILP